MTWIAPKLNQRVQIGKPIQTPNEEGGFDFAFDAITTIWMGVSPVGYKGTGLKYIRGKQVNDNVTHEFICRYLAVTSIGKAFAKGFSDGYKSMAELNPLKGDYYLFFQKQSTVKGRLFRIDSASNVNEADEYFSIAAEEIEERGTGYPA
jgi:Phage head-tail joining protein